MAPTEIKWADAQLKGYEHANLLQNQMLACGGLMASLPIWLLRLLSLPRSCSGAAQNATNLAKSANIYMTSRKAEAQRELRNCQADLQRKSDLCDTLSTRLSSLLVAPSHPKRLSKDSPPFDGEEKDMKKRQQLPLCRS